MAALRAGDGARARFRRMTPMRAWWTKLRAVAARDRIDRELRDEIEAHLQMEVDENLERGMSAQAALDAARRRFGNTAIIRESSREAWIFRTVETFLHDLRHGLRLLGRSPGFAFTALSVIALGIGATTAAFTLLDYVLVRPLPFAEPNRLALLYETQFANGIPRTQTSPPNYLDLRSMNRTFESMGAYMSILFPVNLSDRGEPLRLDSSIITAGVIRTLGVDAAVGRIFTDADDAVGAPNVVLLANSLAVGLFGTPEAALGQTVSLDNQPHTIVGVMPAGFAFPKRDAQLWRPLRFSPGLLALRSNHVLYAVGRLRPGVSMAAAAADMDVVADQLRQAYPKDNARSGIAVVDIRQLMTPQSRMLVVAIFGAALCLLLIACTNLANLLYARALARQQEVAVRVAIGAARSRLLRQLLTESLALAAIGGGLGLLLAIFGTPLLARLVPAALPVGATPAVDWRVLAFAAGLTLSTSVLFGLGPALQSWRTGAAQALRTRTAVGGRSERFRSALVLAEVAATVMLLVASGLLIKALWRVQATDPGFRSAGVLTVRTALPAPKYSDADIRRDFYERVLRGARALPGVTAAAYTSYQPMESASGRLPVTVPGIADDPLTAPQAVIHFVTPAFF